MSKYATAHQNSKGPGDARPTALQIIKDEGLVNKLQGRTIVITGVSSGIGIETVRALHATGATIVGTVRNLPKGQPIIDEILSSDTSNKASIELVKMELDSLSSVKAGAKEILDKTGGKINILINNAGIMAVPYQLTEDGHESQFATNHLGHFLLFQLLKNALLSTATPEFPSRVVSVSSMGHRYGKVNFDDYNMKDNYEPNLAYGQSKTANIYLANEVERRYGSKNLHASSLHPGGIATGLQAHLGDMMREALKIDIVKNYMKSPEQGAATTVYAAVSDEWANKGGRYLSNCVEQAAVVDDKSIVGDDGYAEWAYNPANEAKLWADSLAILGLKDDQ